MNDLLVARRKNIAAAEALVSRTVDIRLQKAAPLPALPRATFLQPELARALLKTELPWGETVRSVLFALFAAPAARERAISRREALELREESFKDPEKDRKTLSTVLTRAYQYGILFKSESRTEDPARDQQEAVFQLSNDHEVLKLFNQVNYEERAINPQTVSADASSRKQSLQNFWSSAFDQLAEDRKKQDDLRASFRTFFETPRTQTQLFLHQALYPEGHLSFSRDVGSALTHLLNMALQAGVLVPLDSKEIATFPDFTPRYKLAE